MRAYVNTANAVNPVEIRDVDEPRPKDNEAVVAVKAFSLNRGELALIASRPEGWRPGQDIAGIVVRQAADGSGPGSGTNVYGLVEGAGWSERVAVPVGSLSERPDELSETDSAALPLAGLTALRTLRLGGSLLGQRVLITGATGGVGHLQVQLARLGGAEVMPVRAAEKDLGGPFDLIVDAVGGESLEAAIGLIARHGTIVLFGNTSGTPASIDISAFFGHEGAELRTYFSYDPPGKPDTVTDLAFLAAIAADGRLKLEVGFEADWSRLGEAIAGLKAREFRGKAVMTLGN